MMKPVLALAFAGIVAAQSSVITVFFPDADEQPLLGSIIASVCCSIFPPAHYSARRDEGKGELTCVV
jgi:hypothetical protein